MKPIKVTDIEWANAKHSAIDCRVTWDTMPGETIPFTAAPDDNQPHGRALFSAILNGEYGPIGAYNTERDNTGPVRVSFTYKTDVWRRATDSEVDQLDAALKQASTRMSRMWDDCQTIEHDSDFFDDLYEAMAGAFGDDRASSLLAESGSRNKRKTLNTSGRGAE